MRKTPKKSEKSAKEAKRDAARKRRSWEDDYPTIMQKLTPAEKKMITASKIILPREYLSPSAIGTYIRCGLQFWNRYILGIVSPPSVPLIEGGVHHSVLETNNRHKKKTQDDLPASELTTMFKDLFSDRKKPIEDWGEENESGVNNRAVSLLSDYHDTFAPRLTPQLIEAKIQMEVGPVKMLGLLDVQGQLTNSLGKSSKNTVIDYKTGKKAKSRAELDSEIGIGFYGWGATAMFKKKVDVGICMLKKTKVPVVDWMIADFDDQRIKWLREIIVRIANSISLGSFPPCDPTSWACSERFCGYFHFCRGKK